MKDSKLKFDRECHVLYFRPCKRQIRRRIAAHYPDEEHDDIWEKVQKQYVDYISSWRTDLGGKRNFHNGPGGTYDCIALMSYYTVCRDRTGLDEIEEMESSLFLPVFRVLSVFVDCNRPFFKRMMHRSFKSAEMKCRKWHDYDMHTAPFDKNKPIYYEFTACPVAEFAAKHGLLEVMPALCNPDYAAMELIHARLVRTSTCAVGCKCDYTICGDRDPYLNEHPEYTDDAGYRRNR